MNTKKLKSKKQHNEAYNKGKNKNDNFKVAVAAAAAAAAVAIIITTPTAPQHPSTETSAAVWRKTDNTICYIYTLKTSRYHCQNLIKRSLGHASPFRKISSKY